jgi:two-component system, NtrC family, response regulator GlrR
VCYKAVVAEKILVVDDDVSILRSLARFLRREGYQVEKAQDGNQALRKLEENSFDLVLSDIIMPGMNGLLLAERMRSDLVSTPIILMTAGQLAEQPSAVAASTGAKYLLRKPVDPAMLLQKIRDVLNQKKLFWVILSLFLSC